MYILGWYYTITDFSERFGADRPLIVFETRILNPYYEKLKGEADVPSPLLRSDFVNKYCIVYLASNSNSASMEVSRVNLMIDGLRDILGVDAGPEWIRLPVRLYSRLNDIHCQARPRPTKVQRGERLDLFPARLTHHSVPPLMSLVVDGLLPPMYILGWYYTMNDFAERFGRGDALNVFEARILGPFHEKYGDEIVSERFNSGVDTSNYTTSDLIITKDAVSRASKARDDARGAHKAFRSALSEAKTNAITARAALETAERACCPVGAACEAADAAKAGDARNGHPLRKHVT
ncbi:uncharacterized protein SCHCODRAFT_01034997 [Schizophyllum commune H4-8]|uniref:Uncharacterized protein n=1 Tax=Schizophyllum commune (strain H4-8 / FGSC 9210) TaxID=578458 RepID=D8QF82_SCHCM|nr:uncharacterized protein SCHCODRAFT_01034997 [Schizophyllum commune H4-8]KAI5887531.1 hypothetical protein SCHCODRAFT_01034997 [Schizophyllum commune H4-8]